MPHLTLEALARLVDEAPRSEEQAHLQACTECRAELEAMVEQRHALAALPDLAPGPDQWPALRTRLSREGLLRERRPGWTGMARAAAAAFLFLAGGATGYALRGPVQDAPVPAAVATASGEQGVSSGSRAAETPMTEDAGREVEAAGELFMAALDRYMTSSGAEPADPAARLAVLDNIVLTTAEALHEAPADPIISSYHLSALAQRNAVLRQLSTGSGQPVF